MPKTSSPGAPAPPSRRPRASARPAGPAAQTPRSFGQARGRWLDGRWEVVFARPLQADGEGVRLAPGKAAKVAFAVWEGSSQERAGIKSFSKRWQGLEIE